MADTVIGKVSLTPKGEYDPSMQYEALDVVRYQGNGYIVRQPCRGVEPAEGEYYMLAAERGEPGPPGVTMEQVNEAISTAITGAVEKVYYGTGNTI